jgi:Zn-dependent peptidase ImmA (M78 family)
VRASASDVDAHARRLVEALGDDEPFRRDPEAAVTSAFGITIRYRTKVLSDCDIDGSYNHDEQIVTVDAAAIAPRRRFTILHELAHALARLDEQLADWLILFDSSGRLEEERVANAFAGLVLLPDALVDRHIPTEGPCAYDMRQLAEASEASREAACVRASQRLRASGLVVLSHGSTVQLAITRGLPFGLKRGSDMGPDSFFATASTRATARRSGVRLRFPGTDNLSSTLEADAVSDDHGYTFSVLMPNGAPWVPLTSTTDGPLGHEIDCDLCDRTRVSFTAECRTCGDRRCPDHGCACDRSQPQRERRCEDCNITLPAAAAPDVVYCDLHA